MLNFVYFNGINCELCITSQNKTLYDNNEIREYVKKHTSEFYIGYNMRTYGQFMLKALVLEHDLNEVKKVLDSGKIYSINYPLYCYDTALDKTTLAEAVGRLGQNIETLDVFDVVNTFNIENFNSHFNLIKESKLPLTYMIKTQTQLVSKILKCTKLTKTNDEWDIKDLPYDNKYAKWFLNPANHKEGTSMKTTIHGVPHKLGWGGIHGALNKYEHKCADNEVIIMSDVTQMYPHIMVKYNLLSRAIEDGFQYKTLLDKSIALKRTQQYDKRKPYKDICNKTYGAMGDVYNDLYDPLNRRLVCIYGQLFMIDLIERLSIVTSFKLIQTNTDGILYKINKRDFEKVMMIISKWEESTGLSMESEIYDHIIQKDVNNYILLGEKNKYVGDYVKLTDDMLAVNHAVREYLINHIPVEQTINYFDNLKSFQHLITGDIKIDGHLEHGTFRIFASVIGKKITRNGTKIPYVSERSDIFNSDVTGVNIPSWLDKKFYIDLAKDRINKFKG